MSSDLRKKLITLSSRKSICCGLIYEGPNGAVALDHRFMFPCEARRQRLFCPLNSAAIVNGELNNNIKEVDVSSKTKMESDMDSKLEQSLVDERQTSSESPEAEEESYKVA